MEKETQIKEAEVVKETKKPEVKQYDKPKGVGLKEATEEQLKAGAFDIDQQIKNLQRQYQMIINELQGRQQNGVNKK